MRRIERKRARRNSESHAYRVCENRSQIKDKEVWQRVKSHLEYGKKEVVASHDCPKRVRHIEEEEKEEQKKKSKIK